MDFKHAFLVLHSKQADFFVHLKTEFTANLKTTWYKRQLSKDTISIKINMKYYRYYVLVFICMFYI